MNIPRRLLLGTALAITTLLVTLVACEIGIRCFHWSMSSRRPSVIREIVLDDRLGWRATENYSFTGELQDHAGQPYHADVFTDDRGFRVFGNPSVVGRRKALFLGDSFTHAVQVSASDAYYSVVGEALDFEVFAYGAGGFGTLQQLMILPDILDLVEPDIVVLQLCTNDLYNNHHGLERGSAWSNNGMRRPYWENDEIVYRLPRPLPKLRLFAAKHSRFLYFLFSRFDRIVAGRPRVGTEHRVAQEGHAFRQFAEAVEVTGALLSMIRSEIPSRVPVFAFSGDGRDQEFEALRTASLEAGLVFLDGVPSALQEAAKGGICTRAADGGHWSPAGHLAVAGVISTELDGHLARLNSPVITEGASTR
jgi:hypothetical protein